MVSTGRHHGFESVAEQRVLLALDFASDLRELLSQPFELRFSTVSGWRKHIPDFLAMAGDMTWLIDVRPGERIKDGDRACFAASAEVALAAGWRYLVVPGWQPHVMGTLDTLSARRRPLDDRLGLEKELCRASAAGARCFGELVASTSLPAVARAHLLHLIWHRRLCIDLAQPLNLPPARSRHPCHIGTSGCRRVRGSACCDQVVITRWERHGAESRRSGRRDRPGLGQ